jgi:Alkylmercury lyase
VDDRSVLDARVRVVVLENCLREGSPPSVEQLMGDLHLSRPEVEQSLDRLDSGRHLKLTPGTHRILMAFPFSGIATPYRVVLESGRKYFANCAWDAIAFYPMLKQPIKIESFCYDCALPIEFGIRDGKAASVLGDPPVVYLALPAAEWWKDIVNTCANTMVFFTSRDHLASWQESHPGAGGAALSVDLMLKLSEPIYAGKMDLGYARPSHDRLVDLFRDLQLTGDFWKI